MKTKKPEIYYETMGEAIGAAKEYAEQRGWTVDSIIGSEWDSMAYEVYQTRLYSLHRSGRVTEQCLNITLYRMPSGRYELTTYIN